MLELKPPEALPGWISGFSVFTAGSIEMGAAVDWQHELIEKLSVLETSTQPLTILNPRRSDWDSSWKQEIGNFQFRQQVMWELQAQEKARLIAMYLDPATKSPISLLELGLFARSGKLIVCCPDGFYRKGNVDIVCQSYGVQQVNTLDELATAITLRTVRG